MKQIISLILSFVLLMGTFAVSANAVYTPAELDDDNLLVNQGIAKDKTFVLGDVYPDDVINSVDSYMLKYFIAGKTADYDFNIDSGDIDANGKLSSVDSYMLKACIAGSAELSDYENENQLYSLTIAGRSIAEFSIVIEEDCSYSDNEYMAAEILQKYIKIATGKDLPIVRDSASSYGIYIHDVPKDSNLGAQLGQEGYKYEVVDGELHIYGTDRGNMYAAYEILEDHLGFGFVDNTFTFLYKKRSVDLSEDLSVTFVPGYRFRQSKSTFNSNEDYRARFHIPRGINGSVGFDYDRAKIPASYYGNFVGSLYIDIHSMNYYHQMATGTMPDESYGALDARYYAKLQSGEFKNETEWQPCATSKNEYNLLFQGLLDYIDYVTMGRKYPFLYEDGTHCFSFSLCDNMNWCKCYLCRMEAKKTSYVDIYLNLKNKGAEDIQEYYPGLKLYSLMYDKAVPVEVKPSEHLILVLGGTSCANHPLGTDEECCGNGLYKMSNKDFEKFINDMVAICSETGAELWMWYYPETNNWWLYDIPNIHAIYYDVTWLYDHGITGFYYEGHNLCPGYTFENLKAYMFSQVAFDPEMTLEEYDELIKDYLYKVYGDGWENMWEFIEMYEEAGDLVGLENGGTEPYCFVGAYNRAFDFVSIEYIQENYEYMRSLVVATIDEFNNEKCPGGESRLDRLYRFLCVFDLLGLGATYVDSYVNGDEASRKIYEERYEWLYHYYFDSGMRYIVYVNSGIDAPKTCNLDTNPFIQFTAGSLRKDITSIMTGK